MLGVRTHYYYRCDPKLSTPRSPSESKKNEPKICQGVAQNYFDFGLIWTIDFIFFHVDSKGVRGRRKKIILGHICTQEQRIYP